MKSQKSYQEYIPGRSLSTFFEKDNVDSLVDGISEWFAAKRGKRDAVREACMKEIDENWTPLFQLEVLKKHLK